MTYGIAQMLQIAGQGGGPKGAMEALVAENKAKYKAADGSDLPTKERQRRFREDWAKEMAKDALAREMTKPNNVTASVQSTTVQVTQKIEQLQQQNANVFAIPEYFVYMSRAFATLEGIGLSVDPKYAILSECFPYLAKRLLSDDSPRARGALRTLLYGTNTERGGGELNLAKLREITDGLESYTTSTASAESSLGLNKDGKNAAAEQLATVILSEEDNYVQSLLLREVAVMLDAAARESVTSFAKRFPITLPPPPPKSIAPLLSPITLPLDLARAALQLQQTDDIDAKRLENVRILSDLVNKAGGGVYSQREGTSTNDTESNRVDVARIFREAAARRNALARIGVRFGSQLASTQAEHLRRRQRSIVNSKERELSELAERLAIEGANSWERIASALEQVDRDRSMAKEQSPRKR